MNPMNRVVGCALIGLGFTACSAIAETQTLGAAESPFSEGPATRAATGEKLVLTANSIAPVAAAATPEDFCQCIGGSESEVVKKIVRAFKAPLHSSGLDFTEIPLNDVVAQLQEDYNIPIQIDRAALESAGLRVEEKITVNIHNVSLRSALRLMLKRLQLTYVIQDEVLLITTPEEAEGRLRICVYDVGSIVGNGEAQLDATIDMLESCVATETWAANGGGEAEIRAIKPGLLVISQTAAVHEEIRDLLTTIRNVRGNAAPSAHHGAEHEHAAAEDVVTRSYFLQLNPTDDIDTMRSQVRELITGALPDETWSGRLTDGQPVTLSVFHDRVVVRQTPAVQEKVEMILSDSGVATPASPATAKVGGGGGGGFGGGGGSGGGFFNPANGRDRARPGFGGPSPAANGGDAANPFH